MTKKYLTILSIFIITLVSACGPAPEPTLSAGDIANTAVADAWLAMTATQLAIPTATATIPPTETFTPLPTVTPLLLPTLPPIQTANGLAIGSAPTNNPCYEPPPAEPKGTLVQIRLVNNSKGLVDLNLGMENPNAQGECATYFFRLGRYDQPVVTVLAACYWGYAYITDPTSNARTAAPLCLYETTKTVPVSINAEVIGLQ
jgi:hypothetical protein